MHIDHINISAPKALLEQVKDFYCNVFDLVSGERSNFNFAGYWLYSGDNALIHLSESSVHIRHEEPGHLDHFAFKTKGLSALMQRLDTLGVEYRASYREDRNMTQVFFRDPADVKVEVDFVGERI